MAWSLQYVFGMNVPTNTPEVTLYVTKFFVAGLLKGMTVLDTFKFQSVEQAGAWAKAHKTVPVKSTGGSKYIITDASFQNFAR